MLTSEILANPFSLMMNPAEVLDAVGRSTRLERLQRRVCRPLDKPVLSKSDEVANDYDFSIDNEAETD